MRSGIGNAESPEERLARAMDYFDGLRKLNDRVTKLTRDSITEGRSQAETATSEDELDRIIEQCELCERRLGALEMQVSRYRSRTLLGHRAQRGGSGR